MTRGEELHNVATWMTALLKASILHCAPHDADISWTQRLIETQVIGAMLMIEAINARGEADHSLAVARAIRAYMTTAYERAGGHPHYIRGPEHTDDAMNRHLLTVLELAVSDANEFNKRTER